MTLSNPDVDNLAAHDRQRKRAKQIGIAVGASCFFFPLFANVLFRGVANHNNSLVNLLHLLIESFYVGGPVLGFVAYSRAVAHGRTLVWLRRFRPLKGRVRFHHVLRNASAGIAAPITIADSSYKASSMAALLRVWPAILLGLFLWLLGAAVVAMVALFIGLEAAASFIILGFLWTISFPFLMWRLIQRKGVRQYGPHELGAAQRRLTKLRRPKAMSIGVEVLRCDARIWKDVVSKAVAHADVVVIDVSELTESLRWELRQVFDTVDADRIIVVAEEESIDADRIVNEIRDNTDRIVDRAWVEQALVFYPPQWRAAAMQYEQLGSRLRRAVAARVPPPGVSTPTAGGSSTRV